MRDEIYSVSAGFVWSVEDLGLGLSLVSYQRNARWFVMSEQFGISAEEFDHAMAIAEIKKLRTSLEAATKELEVFTKDIPSNNQLKWVASLTLVIPVSKWMNRIAARGDG